MYIYVGRLSSYVLNPAYEHGPQFAVTVITAFSDSLTASCTRRRTLMAAITRGGGVGQYSVLLQFFLLDLTRQPYHSAM